MDALVALLLTSPFLLARYAWDALAESGDGRFLAVASVHGLVASPFKAGYVAAKHGVDRTREDDRARGRGRRHPRGRALPRLRPDAARRAADRGAGRRARRPGGAGARRVMLAPQAVKRLIEPEEVAEVAAFLLGPGGRSFTGVPVVLDNGWTAR